MDLDKTLAALGLTSGDPGGPPASADPPRFSLRPSDFGDAWKAIPPPPLPYHLNTDRSAAVSTDTFYSEDMAGCPRGVKLILLTAGGVAVLGHYTGDSFYVGWHALPRKKPK